MLLKKRHTVLDQHQSEKPRERCLQSGPSCLSLRECLALILSSGPPGQGCLGLASEILNRPGQWPDPIEEERAFFISMEASDAAFLEQVRGLGPALRTRLMAAFEVGRRYSKYRCEKRKANQNGMHPGEFTLRSLGKISNKRRMESFEWLGFVPVHRNGLVGNLCEIERGVRTHVNTDPAELFARILALRPFGFFLVHNHPSGVTTPSQQDLELTQRVSAIARQLGVRMYGHWIVAPHGETLLDP
ncbi:MAG: hypothetical protein HYX41_03420 [Bdellovibrio sp.]|nr:hypothetical protein [Bdellovibrio sp.]